MLSALGRGFVVPTAPDLQASTILTRFFSSSATSGWRQKETGELMRDIVERRASSREMSGSDSMARCSALSSSYKERKDKVLFVSRNWKLLGGWSGDEMNGREKGWLSGHEYGRKKQEIHDARQGGGCAVVW